MASVEKACEHGRLPLEVCANEIVGERARVMNLIWLLIAAALGYIIWSTHRAVQRSSTPQEKALAIRGAAVFWLLGFVFLAALIFLPNKARVLMMLPAFFVAVSLGKAWRNARERLRREEQARVDLERMKRVN